MGRMLPVQVRAAAVVEFIIVWSGAIAAIPAGLRLCDGTHGTIDMRDRFILGGSPGFADGGDSAEVTHDHAYPALGGDEFPTNDESAHTHSGSMDTGVNGHLLGTLGTPTSVGGPHTHSVSFSTSVTNAHHHNIYGTTDPVTQTIDTRPPWYALAYVKGKLDDLQPGMIVLYDGSPKRLGQFTAGATTTLANAVTEDDDEFFVTADLGITGDFRAYLGSETVLVFDTGGSTDWFVSRGFDGTTPRAYPAGTTISLPKYAICDGSNGTPTLATSFVVGAGATWALGATFGSNGEGPEAIHLHDFSASLASEVHKHLVNATNTGSGGTATFQEGAGATASASPHTHGYGSGVSPADLTPDGLHTHTVPDADGEASSVFDVAVSLLPRFVTAYYLQVTG